MARLHDKDDVFEITSVNASEMDGVEEGELNKQKIANAVS